MTERTERIDVIADALYGMTEQPGSVCDAWAENLDAALRRFEDERIELARRLTLTAMDRRQAADRVLEVCRGESRSSDTTGNEK